MSLFVLIFALLGLGCIGFCLLKLGMGSVWAYAKKELMESPFFALSFALLLIGGVLFAFTDGAVFAYAFLMGGVTALIPVVLSLGVNHLTDARASWLKTFVSVWTPLCGFSCFVLVSGSLFYESWMVFVLGFALIAGLVLLGYTKIPTRSLVLGAILLVLLMTTQIQFPLVLGSFALFRGIPLMLVFLTVLFLSTSVWLLVLPLVKVKPWMFAPVSFVLAYVGIFGVLMAVLPSTEYRQLLFMYTLFGSALGGLWGFLSPIRKWWVLILVCAVIYPFDAVAALTWILLGFLISTLILSFNAVSVEAEDLLLSFSLLSLVVWLFQGNTVAYFEAPVTWVALLAAWQAPLLYQLMTKWKFVFVPAFVGMLLVTAVSMIVLTWLGTTAFILPFLVFSLVLGIARVASQRTVMSPLFIFVTVIFTVWIQRFFV